MSTNETFNISGNFPRGIILAWFSKSGPFPHDWVVCDGTNGTPDLRQKFLRGASDMANVGNNGGKENHIHKFSASTGIANPPDGWNADDMSKGGTPMTTGFEHKHPVSGVTDPVEENSLPPYVDILFIMKT